MFKVALQANLSCALRLLSSAMEPSLESKLEVGDDNVEESKIDEDNSEDCVFTLSQANAEESKMGVVAGFQAK